MARAADGRSWRWSTALLVGCVAAASPLATWALGQGADLQTRAPRPAKPDAPPTPAAPADQDVDPAVAPYLPLVQKCELYNRLVTASEWKLVYQDKFEKPVAGSWRIAEFLPADEPAAAPGVRNPQDRPPLRKAGDIGGEPMPPAETDKPAGADAGAVGAAGDAGAGVAPGAKPPRRPSINRVAAGDLQVRPDLVVVGGEPATQPADEADVRPAGERPRRSTARPRVGNDLAPATQPADEPAPRRALPRPQASNQPARWDPNQADDPVRDAPATQPADTPAPRRPALPRPQVSNLPARVDEPAPAEDRPATQPAPGQLEPAPDDAQPAPAPGPKPVIRRGPQVILRAGPGGNAMQPPNAQNDPAQAIAELRQFDGKPVLWFDTTNYEPGILAFGPKVRGEFALEVVATCVGPQACDLSLFCDDIRRAPGFQFGGYANTMNRLRVRDWQPRAAANAANAINGNAANPPAPQMVDLDNSKLIERGRTYRVRMEVIGGKVRGLVDGELIGEGELDPTYDPARERQPVFYTWRTIAALGEATVYVRGDGKDKLPADQAWAKAFGETTRDQVDRDLSALTDLLGAARWGTREAAQDLLRRAGPLAKPALVAATESGSAEQRERAAALLGELKAREPKK
jgi:hypothetical protein